ncbi:MAG: PAS domain-containing protein [Bacteroidota bacterium]
MSANSFSTSSQRIARVGSWEYTIKTNSIFWSDEMYNIFGVDRSYKVRPDNLGDIIGGDAGKSVTTAIGNLLKTSELFDLTFRIRMPLGYTKWLRMYAFPVNVNGVITGVRAFVTISPISKKRKSCFVRAIRNTVRCSSRHPRLSSLQISVVSFWMPTAASARCLATRWRSCCG